MLSRHLQALLEHPHISAVAVCGIPDAEYGQAIGAVVVAKSDVPVALAAADIIAFAKTKVAPYAEPRRVVFLQELPVNAMGKVSGVWRGSSSRMRCKQCADTLGQEFSNIALITGKQKDAATFIRMRCKLKAMECDDDRRQAKMNNDIA